MPVDGYAIRPRSNPPYGNLTRDGRIGTFLEICYVL